MKTLQMQSCVHENATVECALVEITVPDLKLIRWWLRLTRPQLIPQISD